jgi:hypothetical protein
MTLFRILDESIVDTFVQLFTLLVSGLIEVIREAC